MDCVSQGNSSWSNRNILMKVNVIKVRNLFLWQAMLVNNFMRRNDFSLRRKTTTAQQQDPERFIDKLILYIFHARRLLIKYKYPPSSIIAM